jgi:RNA polymerase sigma factor (sigma-70 family)
MSDRGVEAVGTSWAATQRGGDDRWLIQRCRAGQEAAFDLIVRRYEPMLLRHCARIVGGAAAQDAVQDALLAAWNAIRDGVEIHALRPWLYTIAHRSAIAMLQDERHPESLELADTVAGGRSPVDEATQAARLRETFTALAGLPDAQRAALIGSAVHGQSGTQIARQLGISECTARQLVFRARATLRSGAAACLLPPAIALRLIRRAAGSPARLATLVRGGAASGQAEVTGRLLKVAATAVAAITLVGSGAFHLIAQPDGRGRGTHAPIRGHRTAPPALPGVVPARLTITHHGIDRRPAGSSFLPPTAAPRSPNGHSRTATATTAERTPGVAVAVEPPAPGQIRRPSGPAIPDAVVRAPSRAPDHAVTVPADASRAVAAPAVSTPAVTTPSIAVPAVSLPVVTTPSITVPAVSLPAVTTPVVSLPAVSTPAVTLLGPSSAKVTTPPVTVAVVTVPGLSIPAVPTSP